MDGIVAVPKLNIPLEMSNILMSISIKDKLLVTGGQVAHLMSVPRFLFVSVQLLYQRVC